MNIHENTALLDAFVDGELTSEEMISVQSHLDECPECRDWGAFATERITFSVKSAGRGRSSSVGKDARIASASST